MKFKYTILYVADVEETLRFFDKAFVIKQAMLHESGDYGELDTGSTTLSFSWLKLMTDIGKNPGKANPASPTFEIAFETDDVPAALAKALAAGASLVQEVQDMPWGQTTVHLSHKVQLYTPAS